MKNKQSLRSKELKQSLRSKELKQSLRSGELEKAQIKIQKNDYISAVGRRKEAVARVRLYANSVTVNDNTLKKGDIIVNGKSIGEYFGGEVAKTSYLKPFELTNTVGKFATTSKVEGGGLAGQLGAVIHGIARVLEKCDKEKFRPALKKAGLLTRDARIRQRRMVGTGGKARRKKQSPKR